jgi:hypothetical protein
MEVVPEINGNTSYWMTVDETEFITVKTPGLQEKESVKLSNTNLICQ